MQCSEMRGVLLVPSSSPALPPIYDGLDVSVTYNITWFHLNHDMVSRRICKLSFYGRHSITHVYRSTRQLTHPTIEVYPLSAESLYERRGPLTY